MYGDLKTSKDRLTSKFSQMSDKEKDSLVNAGNGRLTKEQSVWKTRSWPIMKVIREGKVPEDTFSQLAYNHFK